MRFGAALLVAAALAEAHSAPPLAPAQQTARASLLRCRGGVTARSARRAFADASARALGPRDDLVAMKQKQPRSLLGDHIRGVVFGGMDGILTTFALLAAVAGSRQTSTSLIMVIGISTVIADALSMAAGEYLSAKAELEADPRGKVAASADEPGPMEKAFAMFVAFSLFGSMPLLGFIAAASLSRLSPAFAASEVSNFFLSVIITAGTLFALGTVKSQFGAGVWWRSGLEVSAVTHCADISCQKS